MICTAKGISIACGRDLLFSGHVDTMAEFRTSAQFVLAQLSVSAFCEDKEDDCGMITHQSETSGKITCVPCSLYCKLHTTY